MQSEAHNWIYESDKGAICSNKLSFSSHGQLRRHVYILHSFHCGDTNVVPPFLFNAKMMVTISTADIWLITVTMVYSVHCDIQWHTVTHSVSQQHQDIETEEAKLISHELTLTITDGHNHVFDVMQCYAFLEWHGLYLWDPKSLPVAMPWDCLSPQLENTILTSTLCVNSEHKYLCCYQKPQP